MFALRNVRPPFFACRTRVSRRAGLRYIRPADVFANAKSVKRQKPANPFIAAMDVQATREQRHRARLSCHIAVDNNQVMVDVCVTVGGGGSYAITKTVQLLTRCNRLLET